jgi:hypothetical protein
MGWMRFLRQRSARNIGSESMKNTARVLCGALVMSTVLIGCGGGGGGGGSGDSAGGANSPGAPIATEARLTVQVTVNGTPAAADAAGIYAVKPGDVVAVTSSETVNWQSSNNATGGITLRNPAVGASTWSAQLVNPSTDQALYIVTASGGSGASGVQPSTFRVAGGDARNGTYAVFATNGTRQTLALNFDIKTYEMSEGTDKTVAGALDKDPMATGTYVFGGPGGGAVTTARFRLAQDTIVGAFPFGVTQSPTVAYAVQPFIASRALTTTQAALDGVYNRFGIDVSATAAVSDISQFRVSAGGTSLVRCADLVIYRVDNCPTTSLQTWSVSPGPSAGIWRMVQAADPANYADFAMARVGDQKIFLIAGKLRTDPMASVFRIGVAESGSWPTGRGHGSSTKGSWGQVDVGATESFRTAVSLDGTSSSAHNIFGSLAPLGPQGIRPIVNGAPGETYFAMQGAGIFAIVGARNPQTGGYLQLNLMD